MASLFATPLLRPARPAKPATSDPLILSPSPEAIETARIVAEIAAREYRQGLDGAADAIAAGRSRQQVEDRLQCWLAIAIRAGAHLPEIDQILQSYQTEHVYRTGWGWQDLPLADAESRRDCANRHRPYPVMRAQLGRELAAAQKHDVASPLAQDLQLLADWFDHGELVATCRRIERGAAKAALAIAATALLIAAVNLAPLMLSLSKHRPEPAQIIALGN